MYDWRITNDDEGSDNNDEDDKMLLWNDWLTKDQMALSLFGTVTADSQLRKLFASREQI